MEAEKLEKIVLGLLVILVFCGVPAKGDLDTGLIARWTFDEGSGSTAYDLVGGNHGTIYGAQWTDGIIGGALNFDGIGDYVKVPDADVLDFAAGESFTLCAWLKYSTANQGRIQKYNNISRNGYNIFVNNAHTPGLIACGTLSDGVSADAAYNGAYNDGEWHLAALVRDQSGNHIDLYVDGLWRDGDVEATRDLRNSGDLHLGGSWMLLADFFEGDMDDVRIYGRALSVEGIEQLYQQGAAPPVQVAVDIKPGSCPNPLNPASRGILPVAVLGAEDFDVNAIDIASIRLEGVAPVRSNYEDVSTPVVDGNECDCSTTGPDGYADLTLKFRTRDIVAELATQIEDLTQGDMLALSLTGTLTDGTAIEGQDCVVIVGKVPKAVLAKKSDINEDGIVNNYDFAEMAKYWLEYADLPD